MLPSMTQCLKKYEPYIIHSSLAKVMYRGSIDELPKIKIAQVC